MVNTPFGIAADKLRFAPLDNPVVLVCHPFGQIIPEDRDALTTIGISPIEGYDYSYLYLQFLFRFRHIFGILHPFFHCRPVLSMNLPSLEGFHLYGE